jgi:hypothetical protein
VGRKLRNGVLGGLAALAALYAFGALGLLAERLTGRQALSPALAILGLAAAVGLGVLVLCRLSRLTGPSISPVNRDVAANAEPSAAPERDRL